MAPTWTDPRLGKFTFDDVCTRWEAVVAAPGFDVLTYDWNKKPTDPGYEPPNGHYELKIDDEQGTTDRAAAVALALKVLGNQVALAERVVAAVWDDINGRGGDSGMWWHGDFSFPQGDPTGLRRSFIIDGLTQDGLSLERAEDLKQLLRLREIVVRNDVGEHGESLVELRFDAAFEIEHGIGILTDGDQILGTGYQVDVEAFRAKQG